LNTRFQLWIGGAKPHKLWLSYDKSEGRGEGNGWGGVRKRRQGAYLGGPYI